MSAPRIGVSGAVCLWDGLERTGVNAAYLKAVLASGGVPVLLSPLAGARHASRVLEGLDGLLLTGGTEDVHPELYGEEPSPLLWPPSRDRDLFELALVAAARQGGLPILGVCRGMQLINVALGGTLYQDLPSQRPSSVNHRPNPNGARGAPAHRVRLAPGSRTAHSLQAEDVTVNSIHHQGVMDPAPGLVASGWAEDGLIEAVEAPPEGPWLVGVQWHPEEMHATGGAPHLRLFEALVGACRAPRPYDAAAKTAG